MIDPQNVPEIHKDEVLARFVLSRSHLRANKTLKANAFLPPPKGGLSVVRHKDATEVELWSIGEHVATAREKTLYGRGDISVVHILEKKLQVLSAPLPENPNHANVIGWPSPEDKPARKLFAEEIAAAATFVSAP